MRRSLVCIGLVALLLLAAGSALGKGAAPRLDGSFKVKATIGGNDIGIPSGTVTTDTYVFKSTCKKGGCAKVSLTRKSGGRNVKSTLSKKAPGIYAGKEGPEPYTCVKPLGAQGTFTSDVQVKVAKKTKAGLAKKITGKLVVHIAGCTETYEEATLAGTLSP
jgi:hypothetical protein